MKVKLSVLVFMIILLLGCGNNSPTDPFENIYEAYTIHELHDLQESGDLIEGGTFLLKGISLKSMLMTLIVISSCIQTLTLGLESIGRKYNPGECGEEFRRNLHWAWRSLC